MNAQLDAIERLTQTRQRLSEAIQGSSKPFGANKDPLRQNVLTDWLAHLKAQPVSGMLLNVVRTWWSKHPLRLALMLGGAASHEVLRPTAQAHPYRMVLVAAGVGGLIAMLRPWRFVSSGLIRAALRAG